MRSAALLALTALAPLATAQTFSDCDPTEGDKCDPDPAFGECQSEIEFDFAAMPHGKDGWKDDGRFNEFWTPLKGVDSQLSVDDDGMAFTLDSADQRGPLIASNKRLFFGRVEVEVKAAPGVGMVTSVVLESKDRDEIDWVRCPLS
ncbi:family 16 glycosylhydrolase [Candidatus Bathyarchaeota archaeon]|nr:family 16 glycosylhydrolase [Candidatus Bathyarchaeota archaeon]